MLPCMGGYADDVVDDVYYWADKNATETFYSDKSGQVWSNEEDTYTDTSEGAWEGETEQPQVVTVTFVEDSVTQHSEGTVVKAVIHRD